MTYQHLIHQYRVLSDDRCTTRDGGSPDPSAEEIAQRIAELHSGTAPCCNSHQQGRLRRQARELVQHVEITHVGMGARRNGKIQMGDDE